ncbi:hypothetical protein V9T40_010700 [Parthenolecanium corni]|uniref:Uncharacterized protein n=1 Tax=Parthenolecanium corni TaxID=536013 RepID=A0AAN9XXW2_9HEMI
MSLDVNVTPGSRLIQRYYHMAEQEQEQEEQQEQQEEEQEEEEQEEQEQNQEQEEQNQNENQEQEKEQDQGVEVKLKRKYHQRHRTRQGRPSAAGFIRLHYLHRRGSGTTNRVAMLIFSNITLAEPNVEGKKKRSGVAQTWHDVTSKTKYISGLPANDSLNS